MSLNMFKFDILGIIMTVYSREPPHFLVFRLENDRILLFDPENGKNYTV